MNRRSILASILGAAGLAAARKVAPPKPEVPVVPPTPEPSGYRYVKARPFVTSAMYATCSTSSPSSVYWPTWGNNEA